MAKGSVRKSILAYRLPATVADYPFECCITAWGVFAGIAALIPAIPTPSVTLQNLPNGTEEIWGGAMAIGAITMALALRPSVVRLALLARGMTLCAVALVCFGVAVFGSVGLPRALTGGLLVLVGLAAGIRASRLRSDYYTALEELTSEHRDGNGGEHQPKEG